MNKEITLSDFFGFIFSKLKQIIIFGIIGAILTFAFVKFVTKPTYTCTGTILINPIVDYSADSSLSATNSKISIAKNLMPTYLEIFTSKDLSEHLAGKINEKYGKNINPGAVRSMTKYSAVDNSLIIKYTCSSKYSETTKQAAEAIAQYAPEYVQNIIKYGEIVIIDSIDEPVASKSNPYVMAMVAFMVVAVAVIAINLLIVELDTRLKSVDDIPEHFNYPVLGNIPNFYAQNKIEPYKNIKHGGEI